MSLTEQGSAGDAKQAALSRPAHRNPTAQKPVKRHLIRLPPVKDALSNVGSKEREASDGEASESFLLSVAETYADERLYEEDRRFRYMHHTKVCFTDGAVNEVWVEPGDLGNFALELDL